jgi:hypothetical protein
MDNATTGECVERFYKELVFCLLKNYKKLRIFTAYVVGFYPRGPPFIPALRLQTTEQLEFLQLISHVECLNTLAIEGDVTAFAGAIISRNGFGVQRNLKLLSLSRTLRSSYDLRLALLEFCPNIQKVNLCVDIVRLNLASAQGDRVFGINLARIISLHVSESIWFVKL